MWKKKPVVGGCVGGIALQIENGENGYLITHVLEAEKLVSMLLNNPKKRRGLGMAAHDRVRKYFLLPRYLRDQLKIATDLVRTDRLFV
jgi:trehalose synthase